MLQCAPLSQSIFALMPNNPTIDTTVLITILGLIAAVWAVVPANTRLRFRLGMSWIDWSVAVGVFLVIHYLVFEQFFRSVGAYYSLGPWRWGLDKGSAVYLLLLSLALYILVRARKPKLANRSVGTFEKLVNTLLLTRRYDELFNLVEPHIFKLFKLTKSRSVLIRLINKIFPRIPRPNFYFEKGTNIVLPAHQSFINPYYKSLLASVGSIEFAQDRIAVRALILLKSLLNQPEFVSYVSVCHPHFCLKILAIPEVVREDFTELWMVALISDTNSLLYSELKNSENLNGRYRLAIPYSNQVLYFLFNDVATAERLAIYSPIGDCVCKFIDEDSKLAEEYNRHLGNYEKAGRYRCPVYAGIRLFEIMIHEAIHQGLQDHLWLFYFPHFIEKILNRMKTQSEKSNSEWPTPFHYLIYKIVVVTANWISDCVEINEQQISEDVKNDKNFDLYYIPKQAIDALSTITQEIILSPQVDDRFKSYTLEIALKVLTRIQNEQEASEVAKQFITSMIEANGYARNGYKEQLYRTYNSLDHAIRYETRSFVEKLEKSLSN